MMTIEPRVNITTICPPHPRYRIVPALCDMGTVLLIWLHPMH